MIKPLILAFATGFLLPAPPLPADMEINAKDIARHLGLRFWKIPKEDLPDHFSVYLTEIKDGKVAEGYTNGLSAERKGDLTITVTTDPDGTCAATVAIGDASMRTNPKMQRKIPGTGAVGGFSPVVLNQPMVLMADYKVVNGRGTISQNIEDVVHGLAVVIVPREGARAEAAPTKSK